jgi:hypothetical protein
MFGAVGEVSSAEKNGFVHSILTHLNKNGLTQTSTCNCVHFIAVAVYDTHDFISIVTSLLKIKGC